MSFASRMWFAATIVAGIACVGTCAAGQDVSATHQTGVQWLKDEQTGCRAPDPDFTEGDGIVWTGACANGVIDGQGSLTYLNKGQPQVTISGAFRNGDLLPGRASLAWPDGSNYDGEQTAGKFNGEGTFVSAQRDHLEGTWKNGKLNGHAVVSWANGNRYEGGWLDGKAEGHGSEVWANGDRYEGDWVAGKAHGHGVQLWANGQSYVGEWNDDQPNGTGKLARADGTSYSGKFVDGRPQGVQDVPARSLAASDVSASVVPTAAPTAAALPATLSNSAERSFQTHSRLNGAGGKTLLAVDGSSIALAESESGFTRAITKPDGATATTTFAFVNERMGTVADADDPSHVTGMFKMTDSEIDIDYSDGHSETLRPGAGGVTLSVRAPNGQTSCMAWYPEGHAFSDAEKKAALAEYAARLGVTLKGADAKTMAHPSTCNAPAVAAKQASIRTRNMPHPLARPIPASYELVSSTQSQPIIVHTPEVHLIDQPKPVITAFAGGQAGTPATPSRNSASAPQPSATATLSNPPAPIVAPGASAQTTTAPIVSPAAAQQSGTSSNALAAYQPDTSDPGASNCLTVASDGAHWGFKNSCNYTVQFVYCLKGASEQLASCKDGAIAGSAAPESFSALVADASLKESNVDHQFRWVACGGGAGEVIPKLDGIDPPMGRCLRARTAAN